QLEYPSGMKAARSRWMFAPHRLDVQVVGTEGSLTLLPNHLLLQTRGAREGGEQVPLPEEVAHGERGPATGVETALLRLYEEFQRCVKENRQPPLGLDTVIASSDT